MGRKIPAKKHRGVKDPLVQQVKRLQNLKGKINAPPRDPDEQPVPKSLLRLFPAQRLPPAAAAARPRRRPARAPAAAAPAAPRNPVARLQRLPGESARQFAARITGATRALHNADDPHHYPHEEQDDDEATGEGERRGRGRGRRGERAGGEPRESRAHRRRARLLTKKREAAQSAALDAAGAARYERVSFGEQAHAPPALPAPRLPRAPAAPSTPAVPAVPRPGRRDLLLTRLLAGGGVAGGAGGAGEGEGERRRAAAVLAYREHKKRARLASASARAPRTATAPRTAA